MNHLNRLLTPFLVSGGLAFMLTACGGAPGSSSGGNTNGDIVQYSDIPTSISLGFNFDTATGSADTIGVVSTGGVLLANVVGNEAFDGQVVEFVTSRGIIEDACLVVGAGCDFTWTSAQDSVRPNATEGTTMILAIVPNAAEPFADTNGNNLYDLGEPLTADYSEPYLDADNSGTFDANEFFFDQNDNGIWDDANGEWDGPCSLTSNPACETTNGIAIFDQGYFPLLRSDGSLANEAEFCNPEGGVFTSSIIEDLCTEEEELEP